MGLRTRRSYTDLSIWIRGVGLLFAAFNWLNLARAASSIDAPIAIADAPWAITNLIQDLDLSRRYIFNIAFEKDSTAWIAVSDGLLRYDGYAWRRYGKADGLPSDFVRAVCVDSQGRLWVGTDRGAGVFDGKSFASLGSERGLAGLSVRRIYQDPDGSLWFCSDPWPDASWPGGLTRYQDGRWKSYRQSDGLPSDHVYSYHRDAGGNQYVFTRKGWRRKSGEQWVAPAEPGLSSERACLLMVEAATGEAFLQAQPDNPPWVRIAGRWESVSAGGYGPLCVTRRGEVFNAVRNADTDEIRLAQWTGARFAMVSAGVSIPHGSVETIAEAPDGSIWCVGPEVVLRWQPRGGEWTPYAGLPPARLVDHQGRVWFADDRRVYRSSASGFERVNDWRGKLALDAAGDVWNWDGSRVSHAKGTGEVTYGATHTGLDQVEQVLLDGQGRSWFRGKNEQGKMALSMHTPDGWRPVAVPELAGSESGKVAGDPRSGVWVLAWEKDLTPNSLLHVTPERNRRHELPARVLNSRDRDLFVDRQGVWCFGFAGLHRLEFQTGASWQRIDSLLGGNVYGALSDGDRTCFLFDGRSGGGSGYALFREGRLTQTKAEMEWYWARGEEGTFYLKQGAGFIAIPPTTAGRPFYLALPAERAVLSLVTEKRDSFWITTPEAVLHYQPNHEPPRVGVTEWDRQVRAGDALHFRTRGIKRWAPRHPQSAFLFSWSLDEGQWSPFQPPPESVSTAGLRPDVHRLRVRSQFEGRENDAVPVEVVFAVTPVSLQDRVWFRPAAAGLFVLLLLLATSAWVARQKLAVNAGRLEESVKERTLKLRESNASLTQEIADRKQAEQALKQSEERYRTLVDTQGEGLIVLDRELNCRFANPAAATIFGTAPGQLAGRHLGEFLAPDQLQALPWRSQPLGPGEKCAGELELLRPDHSSRSLLLTATPAADAAHPDAGVLVIFHDISERKELEVRLRQAQKMEAVGQLAGGIAHDFNNLLSVILGHCSLLQEAASPEDESRESLAQIAHAAQRAADLTRQLLLFGRRQTMRETTLDLNALIDNLLKMLRRLIGEHIVLVFHGQAALPLVDADAGMMEQVAMNLSVNARDAMPQGGHLTIGTSTVEIMPDLAHANPEARPGRFVCLRVTDTGSGMDEATRKRVFEPFFTTKEAGKGTGLGLATVYSIVKQHRGWTEVESAPGQGCTFRVFLPVSTAPAPEAVSRPLDRVAAGGHETVLLVEDEFAVRRMVAQCLRRHGYRVLEATTGVEAYVLWRRQADEIDLLLTDMVMPDRLTGWDLAQRLRAEKPGLKVVLASGYSLEMSHQGVPEGPGIAFLAKPFEMAALVATVRQCLDGA